jgi:hypothetical protein
LANGSTFTFYTRTETGSLFPDRLELRLCATGACTDVGEFSTLLTSLNSGLNVGGYPDVWTAITVTLSGVSSGATGRFGFRYYVTDSSVNGDYIGIDSVLYDLKQLTVPEPGALGLMLLGLAMLRRRVRLN